MDPEAFLDMANQVIKLKMFPYFDIAHSLLCALAVREDLGAGELILSDTTPLTLLTPPTPPSPLNPPKFPSCMQLSPTCNLTLTLYFSRKCHFSVTQRSPLLQTSFLIIR